MESSRGSGRTLSPWMRDVDLPRYSALDAELHADVCVVGAGIAGLSIAYELAREGRSVVVLEDGATIGAGETARTTAHLSNALTEELEACHRAGLTDVEWVDRAPLGEHAFDTGRCLRFPRQAQFHPVRYLAGLAE